MAAAFTDPSRGPEAAMDDVLNDDLVPVRLRSALSLGLTVLAALLYAVVLGSVIIRTYFEAEPVFSEGIERAASLLSGLVGSVVTAGFAKGRRPATVAITAEHPLGGRAITSWSSLERPSLVRCRFLGLASIIGLQTTLPATWPATEEEASPDLQPGLGMTNTLWVSLLYFALYFAVGGAAFALTILRSTVPGFVSNASWVWLGTVVSSSYAFFSVDSNVHVGVQFTAERRGGTG